MMTDKKVLKGRSIIKYSIDERAMIGIRDDESILSMFPNGCRLEVGTPGVGAILSQRFQYKKNIGRTVSIKYKESAD